MGIATIRKKLEAMEQKTDGLAERLRFEEAVKEMEAWVEARKREFNSPESRAERKRWYEELQRQGEQRRKEFYERWDEL